jgi:hypothetical protein
VTRPRASTIQPATGAPVNLRIVLITAAWESTGRDGR